MKWLQTSTFLIVAVCLILSGCVRKRHHTDDSAEADSSQQADTATVDDSPMPADQSSNAPPVDPAAEAPVANSNEGAAAPVADAATPPPTDSTAAVSTAGTGELGTYSVQKGDTLMKIAFNLYGDIDKWNDIFQMNKEQLHGMGKLRVGQVLKYDKPASAPVVSQNGDPYMIKIGDTLGKIADDVYGKPKKWRAIYENNRQLIKDPNRIFAGFYLYYQITEEERQEATRIKASRPQTLGAAPAAAAGTDAAAAPAPADAAPAAEQAPVNTSALSPGNGAGRMPASQK